MEPEQAALAQEGLSIVAAQLRGDGHDNEILSSYLTDERFPRVADALVGAAIVVVDIIATGVGKPFEMALRSINRRSDVALLPDLPVGPWDEALTLTARVQRGDPPVESTMDVPSAINVAFQLLVSALTDVVTLQPFVNRKMTPRTMAEELALALKEGHGTD